MAWRRSKAWDGLAALPWVGLLSALGIASPSLVRAEGIVLAQQLNPRTPASEDEAWQLSRRQDTIEAYIKFLETYPAGKYAAQARERQQELETPKTGASTGAPPPSSRRTQPRDVDAPEGNSAGPPARDDTLERGTAKAIAWDFDRKTEELKVRVNGETRTCRIPDAGSVSGLGVYTDGFEVRINFERTSGGHAKALDFSWAELCTASNSPPAKNPGSIELPRREPNAREGNAVVEDPLLLREIRDRLYELNFDPGAGSTRELRAAILDFQAANQTPADGQATMALLTKLREAAPLQPWGAIVFAKGANWGVSWGQSTRQKAVADARASCGSPRCSAELSFSRSECGAFASSNSGWAMLAKDRIDEAKKAAVAECSKRGSACRIVVAVCADGSGRTSSGN